MGVIPFLLDNESVEGVKAMKTRGESGLHRHSPLFYLEEAESPDDFEFSDSR